MSKADQDLVQNWMDLLRSDGDRDVPTTSTHVVQPGDRGGRAVQSPATSANVTAASPTGKITLGSVLGNTPTRSATRTSRRRSPRAAT